MPINIETLAEAARTSTNFTFEFTSLSLSVLVNPGYDINQIMILCEGLVTDEVLLRFKISRINLCDLDILTSFFARVLTTNKTVLELEGTFLGPESTTDFDDSNDPLNDTAIAKRCIKTSHQLADAMTENVTLCKFYMGVICSSKAGYSLKALIYVFNIAQHKRITEFLIRNNKLINPLYQEEWAPNPLINEIDLNRMEAQLMSIQNSVPFLGGLALFNKRQSQVHPSTAVPESAQKGCCIVC